MSAAGGHKQEREEIKEPATPLATKRADAKRAPFESEVGDEKPALTPTIEQKMTVLQLVRIITALGFAFLGSQTGAGKTWVILPLLAKALFTKDLIDGVVIVCPANVTIEWEKVLRYWNMPFFSVVSWTSLTSKKKPFIVTKKTLKRISDDPVTGEARYKTLTTLYRNKTWVDTVRARNVLVIADEAHKVKNSGTLTSRAMKKILFALNRNEAREGFKKMYTVLATATLADKMQHLATYADVLHMGRGFSVESEKGFKHAMRCIAGALSLPLLQNKNIVGETLEKQRALLYKLCAQGRSWTSDTEVGRTEAGKNRRDAVAEAMLKILLPRAMAVTDVAPLPAHVFNLFLGMDGKANYPSLVQYIGKLVGRMQNTGDPVTREQLRNLLQKALTSLQEAKADVLVGRVKDLLKKAPRKKVVIFASSLKASSYMRGALSEAGYITAQIVGDVPMAERDEIITSFQRDEDDSVQVIICNPTVSTGFSLHARDGVTKRQRVVFLLASYHTIDLLQSIGRVSRIGMDTSKDMIPHVHVVYGIALAALDKKMPVKTIVSEFTLLQAMQRKCELLALLHDRYELGYNSSEMVRRAPPLVHAGDDELCDHGASMVPKELRVPCLHAFMKTDVAARKATPQVYAKLFSEEMSEKLMGTYVDKPRRRLRRVPRRNVRAPGASPDTRRTPAKKRGRNDDVVNRVAAATNARHAGSQHCSAPAGPQKRRRFYLAGKK